MRPEEYPPQEPFSDFAKPYVADVERLGDGIDGIEISYGPDAYQSIALHVPDDPNGTVFAFVHGGGWTSGYKEHMNFMAPAFTAHGIIFASIGYRLAPRVTFPIGLDDVACGIAWIHNNIAEHGGDPARIFAGGHSAGGHYTPLLAVRRDWQDALSLPDTVIRGCLPISGVYDFGPDSGLSMRPRFLGPERSGYDIPASPISNIQETPPPFLMAHGSEDFPHLVTQAERMEQALNDSGGEVARIVLDGRDHFSASLAGGEADGPWVPAALAFLDGH